MQAIRLRLCLLMLLLAAIGWLSAKGEQPTVLVLYPESYYSPSAVRFDYWFRSHLKQQFGRVNFEVMTVGTGVISPDSFEEVWTAQRTLIEQRYKQKAVDLVVVASPEMLHNLVAHGLTSFDHAKLLVFGLLSDEVQQKFSALHQIDFKYDPAVTIMLARRLQPQLRKIVLLYGSAPLDVEMAANIRAGLLAGSDGVEVEELTGLTMAEFEEALSKLSDDSCVMSISVINDSSGERFRTEEAWQRIAAASRVPVYSANGSQIGNGAIGGGILSYDAIASMAAEVSAKLLKGEPVPLFESFPMEHICRKLVDYRALRRWGLNPGLVPADFEVINRPVSIWATHRKTLLLALSGLVVLSAFTMELLHQNRRLHRTKKVLRDERKQLQETRDQLRLLAKVAVAADEEEHHFIARELHDDISQRIAALALELANFEQILDAGGQTALSDEVRMLRERHVALARSVHGLSRIDKKSLFRGTGTRPPACACPHADRLEPV